MMKFLQLHPFIPDMFRCAQTCSDMIRHVDMTHTL